MGELELEKRSRYSKVIFYDDEIILYKKEVEIKIPIECIDHIEYAKPSLLNYILAIPCYFGGTYPGRLEIYLNKKIQNRKLYIIKIKYDEIWKLPKIFRIKIGVSNHLDAD
ncbi:MAG: hypothetical protein J1G38_07545 [Clostridiales bacterium]|nr:hypothetical protein [Clostridiales bacterium]